MNRQMNKGTTLCANSTSFFHSILRRPGHPQFHDMTTVTEQAAYFSHPSWIVHTESSSRPGINGIDLSRMSSAC